MASAGARAYYVDLGCAVCTQRGPGAEPLVRESGGFAPEAESILAFICLMESEDLAIVRDFWIYYYFVVASLREEEV